MTLLAGLRESLVLDLLRDAQITQGEAALLLGVTRYDILDLMVRYCIPSGPETAEEMRQETRERMAILAVEPQPMDGG